MDERNLRLTRRGLGITESRILWAAISTVYLAAMVSCEGGPSNELATIRQDSAGVDIIQIPDDALPVSFSLNPLPLLSIGGAGAGLDSTLYDVTGAILLEDDRVVIASSGTYELKQFDSQGLLLRSSGGQGEGPGEFLGINWMNRLPGDSIVTFDWYQGRIQVFDKDLQLARATSIPRSGNSGFPAVEPIGNFSDGRLLGWGPELLTEYPREPLYRHLFILSPAGEPIDSIGPFPGGRRIWMSGEPTPPFPRQAAFVIWGDFLYTAISENAGFRRSEIDGQTDQIVRGGLHSRPPTGEDIAVAMEGRPRDGVGDFWVSPLLPFWSDFAVDRVGAVWRRAYPIPEADTVQWLIVGFDGSTIAVLETLLSFDPLDIGEDWVLAVEKDDFDVERVVLYELARGEG